MLLLIFLAVLTGLHYINPVKRLFPAVTEFIPGNLINCLFPDTKNHIVTPLEPERDTIRKVLPDTLPSVDADSVATNNIRIDPLSIFIDSLRHSKGQIRVMYYGDSQIEGDRITSYLRKALREGHGGTGPGLLLPLMPVMYTKSVWVRSSSNWKKYNYLSFKSGEISHTDLGPFMAICRYLPEGERAPAPEKAYIKIRPSNFADNASSEYDSLRIFYSNASEPVKIIVKADDNTILSDTLKTGNGFNETGCNLGRGKNISIEFEGMVSPDIYGISIESRNGVIVDNIPQRGSAGLEFTMVSRRNLEDAYRKLKPDLFILHYGLNIVKNVRNDYSYFQKGLERQLILLKEISPSTPILVLSLTDMAESRGDSIRSYRNIPAIIDAQIRATNDAGASFWNSYTSMGGESSIIKWAEKNPPLAQKDYVHLTYQGADTLSSKLATALFSNKIIIDTSSHKIIVTRPDSVITVPALTASEYPAAGEDKKFTRSLLSAVFRYEPDKPMIFTTSVFWLFFLLVLAGYSLVYRKLMIRNIYLFLISLFFYYKAGGLFLFILIFVTLVDYTCGLLLNRSDRVASRKFIV